MPADDRPAKSTNPPPARRWRRLFSALQERPYRRFAPGMIASITAVWMQRVAQDWLMLETTGSAALVGLLAVCQFGPMLVFGIWGGVIVDRYRTRSLLLITQGGMLAVCAALAIAAATMEQVSPVLLFAGALAIGMLAPVDQPARAVFVGELVGMRVLPNAIAMNSSIFQVGMTVGAAIGGSLLPISPALPFLASAVLAGYSFATILSIRTNTLHTRARVPRAKGQIVETLHYIRQSAAIFWTLFVMTFASLIGLNWSVLLSAMADRVFQTGGTGYGLYTAALSGGSFVGALIALSRVRVRLRSVFVWTSVFMGFKLLASFAQDSAVFVALIACAGAGMVLMWTAANTLLQSLSSPSIRGRVMSLYLLIAMGAQAVGGPLLGWVTEQWGARSGFVVSSGIPLLVTVASGIVLAWRMGGFRQFLSASRMTSAGGSDPQQQTG